MIPAPTGAPRSRTPIFEQLRGLKQVRCAHSGIQLDVGRIPVHCPDQRYGRETCRMGRVASFEFAKPSRCQQLVRTLSFAPLPDPGEQLYTHSLTPSSFGALTSWDRPVPTAACGALHELCGLALCRAGTIA